MLSAPMRWFDDVAQSVIDSESVILCPVCADPYVASELCDWLDAVVPGMSGGAVERIKPEEVRRRVEAAGLEAKTVTLVVPDATIADDQGLIARWQRWNLQREALRAGLLAPCDPPVRRVLVLITTENPLRAVGQVARDLLSVAEVMRVQEDLPALDAKSPLVPSYRAELDRLEHEYQLSTQELMRKLYELEDLPDTLSEPTIRGWQHVAQLLRKV